MFQVISEEKSPARVFKDRTEAQAAADNINNTPRRGIASILYSGYADGWLVEVKKRGKEFRYSQGATLRVDGTVAKYH